ncbi:MAG: hypothetical protein ACRCXT_02115 [Paraclostridium sp.]
MSLTQTEILNNDAIIKRNFSGNIETIGNRGRGLLSRNELDYYNKFNRVGVIDPYNALAGHKEYIFFTRPDLQLLSSSSKLMDHFANKPFFIDSFKRFKDNFYQLQSSVMGVKSGPYINCISTCVLSSLELPTITSGEVDNPDNIYGDTITYRWSSGTSSNDFDFSLEFGDTKYGELYMLFRIWDEYINQKQKGNVVIPDSFVLDKILHDQVSVFKIVVDSNHEDILFYSKITGVYPKSVPRDIYGSLPEDGVLKFNIEFKGAFVEDMTPEIIDDFNHIFNTYKGIGASKDIPIYDTTNGIVDTRWVNIPRIVPASQGFAPGPRYKLKWR